VAALPRSRMTAAISPVGLMASPSGASLTTRRWFALARLLESGRRFADPLPSLAAGPAVALA
jgi:hypothetical protein